MNSQISIHKNHLALFVFLLCFFLPVMALSLPYQQDPGADGIVSIEVENFDTNMSQGGHDWAQVFPSGYSGTAAMEAQPNIGTTNNTGYESNSPRLDFVVNFVKTGTHYVWIRGIGASGRDDSVHVGLDGVGLASSDRITGFSTNWTWSQDTMDVVVATVNVATSGVHTVNVWMREDGFVIDKIVLTVSASYIPSGVGPAESPRGNTLVFTPNVLNFTVEEGGTTPSQTTDLDTSDSSVASYTVSDDATWLAATPTSGSTPATLTVSIDATGLTPNTYTATITGTASGYSDDTVDVTLTVTSSNYPYQQDPGADGIVSIEVENFDTNVSQGGHDWAQVFPAGHSGLGAMEASPNIETNNDTGYEANSPRLDFEVNFVHTGTHYVWIRGIGASGRDDSVHVGLDGVGLPSSDRISGFSTIWAWSQNTMDLVVATVDVATSGVHTVNVWMREDGFVIDKIVLATSASYTPSGEGPAESPRANSLVFNPDVMAFTVEEGGSTPSQTTDLDTRDSSIADYTVSDDAAWLTVVPSSGQTPATLTVSIDATGLSPGTYTATITGTASGYSDDTVDVTLTVTSSNYPYQQDPGADGIVSIEVENFDTNVSQGGHDWAQVFPAGHSGLGAMEASPNIETNNDTGYEANSPRLDFEVNFVHTGTHYVWIRGIGASGRDDSVHVGLDGVGLPSSDRISGFSTIWAWSQNTMDLVVATVDVATSGVHTVNVWMREDGFVIDKTVLTTSASYTPSGEGPAESPRANSLVFNPDVMAFTVEEGGSTPSQTTDLDTSDSSIADYTVSDDAAWLTVVPSSGQTPATLTVSIDATGLSPGTYTATITGTASGYSDDTVDVTLTVTSSNSLVFNPDVMAFTVEEGGSTPSQTTDLDTSDSSIADYTVSDDAAWLTVVPSSGQTPATLTVSIDATGLSPGTYTATITGTASGYSDDTVDVTLTVTSSNYPYQQDPGADGIVSIEVENFDTNVSQGGHDWAQVFPAGHSGLGAMEASPNIETSNDTGYEANSPRLDFEVNFVHTGTHYVWIRGIGASGRDDSVHVGLDGVGLPSSDRISGFSTIWAWSQNTMDLVVATVDVATSGVHTVNVWMREDGFVIDKIVLATSASYTPSGEGPAESPRANSLVFNPDVMAFTMEEGGSTPSQTTDLDTRDSSIADYTVSDDAAWLTVVPSSGQTPATLTVSIDATGLSPGTYTATITGTASGYSDDTVDVTLLSLPFLDDFNDGYADGWVVFNDSEKECNWEVINGEYCQTASFAGSTFIQSYHTGKYSFFNPGLGLSNYRFSVEFTPLSELGNDIGVMFRYQDNDNYYRLSLNSRYGFTRLEKKVDGNFVPLMTNSRGFQNGQCMNIAIELNGSLIQIYLNGDPLFGLMDDSLILGTVALYCQGMTKFDNVLIEQNSEVSSSVVISAPLSYSVGDTDTLNVSAVVSNTPSYGWVEFILDNSSSVVDFDYPFAAQFLDLDRGDHKVEASLYDSDSLLLAVDVNEKTGSLGTYFVSVGDSITNGSCDNYLFDNTSQSGRVFSIQGYEANLVDMLDSTTLYPTIVFNEGIPGDESHDAAYKRIESILFRHPGSNKILILLGTNDSGGSVPVLSGFECVGAECAGTFKENMQLLIDEVIGSGKLPVVGLVPPIFTFPDPLNSNRNLLIQEYNSVITSELINCDIGPDDLFSFFLGPTHNHFSLFADSLHPNALGHAVMAYLWHNALTGEELEPFILQDLEPSTIDPYLKQNLLEVGDTYYVDEEYTLTSIPPELDGGIWIMTANSEYSNTQDNYISFNVDRNVEVYVAYDPRATTPPNWLEEDNFVLTGEVIGVTDPGTSVLNLYKTAFASGVPITLGGNLAEGAIGALSSYVVIVVEN